MRSARPLLASLLPLLLAASSALAAPVAFKIDSGHSQVGFNIRHFFSRVPGQFNEFSGTINYDEKTLANSSVDVEIKTASIDTNNERRDGDLRSTNFFAADSFPTITFKSTKVTALPDKKMKIEGNLTMRGVTRPVTLNGTMLGMGTVGMGGRTMTRAGWEANGTLNRKDFGIVWNRTLDQGGTMLGDDVNLVIQIEAMQPMPESAAKPPAKDQVKAENK